VPLVFALGFLIYKKKDRVNGLDGQDAR